MSHSVVVSGDADGIYLRGWKSDIMTDRQMTLSSFAAFTAFRNLASFMIGKFIRSYAIDNPCTKLCGKLPELMFVSSTSATCYMDCSLGRGHSFPGNIWKVLQLCQIKPISCLRHKKNVKIWRKYEGYKAMQEIWEWRMGGSIKG